MNNALRTALGASFVEPREHEHSYQFAQIHQGWRDHVILVCSCGEVKFVPTPGKECLQSST